MAPELYGKYVINRAHTLIELDIRMSRKCLINKWQWVKSSTPSPMLYRCKWGCIPNGESKKKENSFIMMKIKSVSF